MTSQSLAQQVVALQNELLKGAPKKLEKLAAALLSEFLESNFYVARSGFQHGADAGTSGNSDRHLRIECKRYSDTTPMNDRELLGEIDQALHRNPYLDAWILVSTRKIDETTRDYLSLKSDQVGLPVIILDWTSAEVTVPDLAALCAFSPGLVEEHYGKKAALLAKELNTPAISKIELLRDQLQVSHIGYTSLKILADKNIDLIWSSEENAQAKFAQNIAIGAGKGAIRRAEVSSQLKAWWNGDSKSPAIAIGDEGVGKTWAIVKWIYEEIKDLPIVLMIPASTFREIQRFTAAGIKDFIAGELRTLAGSRTLEFWRRRVDQILKKSDREESRLLLMVDGINQDPSFQWTRLFEILQGTEFLGRVRVVASSQRHYFNQELRQLSRVRYRPVRIEVAVYDLRPGGELDQALHLYRIERGDLNPGVIQLARNPRMLSLVVRFRDDVAMQGDATAIRLLWAYGRDELGIRPLHAFNENEWEDWLCTLASRVRNENWSSFVSEDCHASFSIPELSAQLHLPHRSPDEILLRLNEIVDGRWMEPVPGSSRSFRPRSEVIALALGLALVEHLSEFDDADAARELSRLLDPVRASSSTADVLASALPISVSNGATRSVVAAIATELLHSQNATDEHRGEVLAIAPRIADPLLDALEHSWARAHASARRWAVSAIRRIPEENEDAWNRVQRRLAQWVAVVDCPTEAERSRSDD